MIRKAALILNALALAFLIFSCNSGSDSPNLTRTESRTINKVMVIAEKYVTGQLKNPEKKDLGNGVMEFSDENRRYIIDPSVIRTGLIDEDRTTDAIITIYTFAGQYQTVSEQLVLLKPDGNFVIAGTVESDMKIISVDDGIITADVPEHTRDTPLFNCPSCWEVVKFRFRQGEFFRME